MSHLKVSVGEKDHIQGDDSALCTLVEYGDYECPHCAAAYPVVKNLQRHFGRKLRFVYRNFPLTQIHQFAEPAAEAAEFAATYQKFWEMHDLIFENQGALGDVLYQLAENLRLPFKPFESALESRKFLPHIQADFAGGVRSGVNGTPTFFINGERLNGPSDYQSLRQAIESAIEGS